jgi:hypothetical protein
MKAPNTDLKQQVDKIGYELMLKTQPGVIDAINAHLDKGGKAKQIERGLLRKFGKNSLTAQMAVGAAFYLEGQREQK